MARGTCRQLVRQVTLSFPGLTPLKPLDCERFKKKVRRKVKSFISFHFLSTLSISHIGLLGLEN